MGKALMQLLIYYPKKALLEIFEYVLSQKAFYATIPFE